MQRWGGEHPVRVAHELPLARTCSWSSVDSYSVAPEADVGGLQHGVTPLAPGGRPVPPTLLLLKQHQKHQQDLLLQKQHQRHQQGGLSWPRLLLRNAPPQPSSPASTSGTSCLSHARGAGAGMLIDASRAPQGEHACPLCLSVHADNAGVTGRAAAISTESPLCSPKAVPICSGVVGNAIFSRQQPPLHQADEQPAATTKAPLTGKVGRCCRAWAHY